MTRIIFTNYYTGKKIKQLTIRNCGSITYGPEWIGDEERFIVRDYWTNKKIRSCAMPSCSCEYRAVNVY